MKKSILVFTLALTATTASAAQLLEGIVVRVGDRIVTRTDYERRLREVYREIDATVPDDQRTQRKADARKNLVNELVSELLLRDRADHLAISVTESDLKQATDRLKQQYGISSDEQFEQSLRSSGMTRADMEGRLRETLLTQKLFARELRSRAEMSDTELRERYNREKESFRLPERAHLLEIVVLRPEDPAKVDEARTRASEVAEAARKAGTDFGTLASTMSEAATKDAKGDLGEVAKGDLVPEIDKAVFNAAAGSILGPIETRSAWHIIKVEQRLPSEVPAFESIKDRLRKSADDETFQRDYKAYIDSLRKDAFIQINEAMIPNV